MTIVHISNTVTLVTSIFLAKYQPHSHERETLAAFAVNLENPHIAAAHVLLESNRGNCSVLRGLLENATGRAVGHFGKVKCHEIRAAPTYASMFEYANTKVAKGTVMVANADVVYDETLGLLAPPAAGTEGHLLSVEPPPFEGTFKEIFGMPCPSANLRRGKGPSGNEHRCQIMARSWDAYIFTPPLPKKLFSEFNMSFEMNTESSEFFAAQALIESGLRLTNPCMFVNAHHWHCFGDKMHKTFRKHGQDFSPPWKSSYISYPCRDFPDAKKCPCKSAKQKESWMCKKQPPKKVWKHGKLVEIE